MVGKVQEVEDRGLLTLHLVLREHEIFDPGEETEDIAFAEFHSEDPASSSPYRFVSL
jgi:hypothetical protein